MIACSLLLALAALVSSRNAGADASWPPATFGLPREADGAPSFPWTPSSWSHFHELSASVLALARANLALAPPPVTGRDTDADREITIASLGLSGPVRATTFLEGPEAPGPPLPPCPDASTNYGPSRQRDCEPRPALKRAWGGLHHELWFVTIEVFAVQSASILIFAALPAEVSGFTSADFGNIPKYAAMGPHFDDDRWGFNFVGHPLAGSEYYLIARNRRAAPWQGFLYAAAWSTFWEYITEGRYERASIQDLIITPLAGAALGEIRYQIRQAILDPRTGKAPSLPLRLLAIAVDPVEAISNAVPLKW